jgi:hypothetical protein
MYDKDWNFKNISLPFYFEEFFVEFCLSISVDKDKDITIFILRKIMKVNI